MKLVNANWVELLAQLEKLLGGGNSAEATAAAVARAAMVAMNFIVLIGWGGVVWKGEYRWKQRRNMWYLYRIGVTLKSACQGTQATGVDCFLLRARMDR